MGGDLPDGRLPGLRPVPLSELAATMAGGATILGITAACLWNRDDRLPDAAGSRVARSLDARRPADPAAAEALARAILDTSVAASRPARAVAAHLLRVSAATLVVAAVVYLMTLPAYAPAFFGDPESLARFLGRLFSSGLVTVFLVGWVAGSVTGGIAGRIAAAGPAGVLAFLLLDLTVRLAALVAITAATYVLFSQAAGSFGGSWQTAIGVVPATLAVALAFESLTSVYVYAALLGGVPLYLILLVKLSARHRCFAALWVRLARAVPIRHRPLRFFGLLLGAVAAAAAMAGSILAGPA